MRTMVAPLGSEVEAQLRALDPRRADIARRYIRRLALEPLLGSPVARGPLAGIPCDACTSTRTPCRATCCDPGARRPPRRRGPRRGPRWRIVYWVQEAPGADVRLIIVLADRRGPPRPAAPTVYELAWTRLAATLRRKP